MARIDVKKLKEKKNIVTRFTKKWSQHTQFLRKTVSNIFKLILTEKAKEN